MTYRERLLEKCGFDEEISREYAKELGMSLHSQAEAYAHHLAGAHCVADTLEPILTALLDECERLSSVLASIDYGFEPKRPGASLAGGWPIHPNSEVHKDIKRTIAAHATAMEKLCGEGER